MGFPPCCDCGAVYAEGEFGTVHDERCPSLPQNKLKKSNLLEFYKMSQANKEVASYIDWNKFAELADSLGLHYHPRIGLMEKAAWETIKDFILVPTTEA